MHIQTIHRKQTYEVFLFSSLTRLAAPNAGHSPEDDKHGGTYGVLDGPATKSTGVKSDCNPQTADGNVQQMVMFTGTALGSWTLSTPLS